ncbi:Uncharacterised protein [uncultured archaeon]|nr:Uncharacterised protein [uncultured archaeon]
MLTKKERKKITDLIDQGKSDYKIGKETGHSPNTIHLIREEYSSELEKKQRQREDGCSDNPIDMIKGFITDLDTLIQTGRLNDKENKVWEKRLEQLREIIRVEVDDRIPVERADEKKKRDQEWNIFVEQYYVNKEGATNEIRKRDETIKEQENYMKTRFEKDVEQDIRQLTYEREIFSAEKTSLYLDVYPEVKREISDSYKFFFAAVEKQTANELREKQLDEREEKIKKREDELKTNNM